MQAYDNMSNEDLGNFTSDITFKSAGVIAGGRSLLNKVKPVGVVGDNISTSTAIPRSIQDRMTLEAAQNGAYTKNLTTSGAVGPLRDPRYQGMHKMEYLTKSANGNKSNVHYVQ